MYGDDVLVWLDVDLRMDTRRTCFLEDVRLCVGNLVTILGSIFDIMVVGGRGGGGQSYMIK